MVCTERLERRWLLSAAPSAAGDVPVDVAKLPPQVVASLHARFPGAVLISAEFSTGDGEAEYDVTTQVNGRVIDATLTPSGEILESEQLPEKATTDAVATGAPVPAPVSMATPPVESTPRVGAMPSVGPAATTSPGDSIEPIQLGPAESVDDDQRLTRAQLPAEVRAALDRLYPGAKIAAAEFSDDEDGPEVGVRGEFDGTPIDAAFRPDGQLIETQEPLAPGQMPPALLQWIRANFGGAKVEDAQAVTKDGQVSYELVIDPPHAPPVEAVFRPGSVQPAPPAVAAAADVPAPPAVPAMDAPPPRPVAWAKALADETAGESAAPGHTIQEQSSVARGETDAEARNESPANVTRGTAPADADARADETNSRAGHPPAPQDAVVAYAVGRASRTPDAQPAETLAMSLPFDAGAIEYRLRALLDEVEALGRRAAGNATGAGVRVKLAAFVALIAGVELVLLGSRTPKGAPVTLFSAPGETSVPPAGPGPSRGSWTRRRRRGGD